MSGEGERVYYVMALRHLLPLALGCHYLRLPDADHMGVAMRADDLAGLECWFVQVRRRSEADSGVQDALSQVADDFVARHGVFGRVVATGRQVPPDLFCFIDHRVYADDDDERAAIGGAGLEAPDLVTVVVAGGTYSDATAGSHWRRSFRIVVDWVDSLRVVGAAPLMAITDVESIHPIYLRVVESADGGRDVHGAVLDEAGLLRSYHRIERETTDRAAHVFTQRLLGNPSVLTLDWTTRAYTARALGDHSQALLYAVIAAEQMIRHLACVLQWEQDRHDDSSTRVELAKLFDDRPAKLLDQIGKKLGFDPNTQRAGCPDEIKAWRRDIAELRNDIMHVGYYPSGAESDRSAKALGRLGEYFVERITVNAAQFPIAALVLCGMDRIRDDARQQVREHADNHDEYVIEYREALTRPADAE